MLLTASMTMNERKGKGSRVLYDSKPVRRMHFGTGRVVDNARGARSCMFCACRVRAFDAHFLGHYACEDHESELGKFVQRWFQSGGLIVFPASPRQ